MHASLHSSRRKMYLCASVASVCDCSGVHLYQRSSRGRNTTHVVSSTRTLAAIFNIKWTLSYNEFLLLHVYNFISWAYFFLIIFSLVISINNRFLPFNAKTIQSLIRLHPRLLLHVLHLQFCFDDLRPLVF